MDDIRDTLILVVDDEKDIRELVRYNLEKRGYKVDEAADGEEALAKIRRTPPSLIILDLMLPKLGGLEVCRYLKNDPLTKKIPIIMLTALGSDVDKIVGLELGADDYVTKPFSPRELVARVAAVLRRVREYSEDHEDANEVEASKGLVVDREKRRILLDQVELDLTLKEYELLELFSLYPDKVFTREHLLNEIWGYDYAGDTRTVDVHVCNLRKKMEDASSNTKYRIETVRGVGYRFTDRG